MPEPSSSRKVHQGKNSKRSGDAIVLDTAFPQVKIGRDKKRPKKIKIDRSNNIESLARAPEVQSYFSKEQKTPTQSSTSINPMTSLVDGINSLPPLTQADVEAHYEAKRNSDAYGDRHGAQKFNLWARETHSGTV